MPRFIIDPNLIETFKSLIILDEMITRGVLFKVYSEDDDDSEDDVP